MTLDDLYPLTKDTTRDRNKTYYVPMGCSFSVAQEDPDPELNCFNPIDGEFRNCHDPWWLEQRGQDYSQMPDDFVPYHEKNEELAGSGEQGAAGGGGGGCGGGGGACGARAKSQEEKNRSTAVLNPCSTACKAAMSVSADPEDLLSGLITLATAVLQISDLLASLIKPEMLTEMQKIKDSTQDLLAKSATEAVETSKSCCGGCSGSCSKACNTLKETVEKELKDEELSVQNEVSLAMDVMTESVMSSLNYEIATILEDVAKCAQEAGDPNTSIDKQISAISKSQEKAIECMKNARTASAAAAVVARTSISSIKSPVAATAVEAAITTADDAISDAIASNSDTLKTALDTAVILGVI